VRLVVRRVFDFGAQRDDVGDTLLTPDAWDAVRRLPGAFHLQDTREQWLADGSQPPYPERAKSVVSLAQRVGALSLCSHGAGGALLEQQVHRLAPELELTCTDFAPETVVGLRELFEGANVVIADLRDPTSLPRADLHLMHRLDQELSEHQWHAVFAWLDAPVVFVPSEILTLVAATKELVRRTLRPRATAAGWFRNEGALRALWSPWFEDSRVQIGDEVGFLLSPRSSRQPQQRS
jgi:hypothetical protein